MQVESPAEYGAAEPVQVIEIVSPPDGFEIFASEYWVWLKTLKASARNSRAVLSLIAKCLKMPMSKFRRDGFRTLLRPASPKVSPCGRTKAPGFTPNLE